MPLGRDQRRSALSSQEERCHATHANGSDSGHVCGPAFAPAENRGALVWEQPPHRRGEPLARTTLATGVPNLRLVALTPADAGAYYDLVDRNRGHLTRHGDYADLGEATPASAAASLQNEEGRDARFGIWLDGRLIGRADLCPRAPGRFVLGYWLGSEDTGKGYATAAGKALIDYGKAELGATDVFAGVTKGNAKSEALLGRLGFRAIEDRGTYTLFTLALTEGTGATTTQRRDQRTAAR